MDNASIILEMLSRIQRLEAQVTELQLTVSNLQSTVTTTQTDNKPTISSDTASYSNGAIKRRDTTKYLFNGAVYSKNRLVLAVVKNFVENTQISFKELSEVFHPSLQGSIGVVERADIAQTRQDFRVRFFTDANETLTLTDCLAYVCNQWGILNIPRFISRAKELGYTIQEIK